MHRARTTLVTGVQRGQQVNYLGPDDYRKFALASYIREKGRIERLKGSGALE